MEKITITKEELINTLNAAIDYIREEDYEPSSRSSILIHRSETLDFDPEEVVAEWAKQAGVNFAAVDIPKLTDNDVAELPNILKTPTVFLYKNYGDYDIDSKIYALRSNYRSLLKDRLYGLFGTPAPNFLFAVAPIPSGTEKNIDPSERLGFYYHLN